MSTTPPKTVTVVADTSHPSFLDWFGIIFKGWLASEGDVIQVVHDPNAQAAISISTALAPLVAGTIQGVIDSATAPKTTPAS